MVYLKRIDIMQQKCPYMKKPYYAINEEKDILKLI